MFPLLILSAVATIALVGTLFDLWEDDVDETLDDIDNADGFSLLDAALADTLAQGALGEIEQGAQVIDADAVRDDYAPIGSVEIEGTDGDDYIDAGLDVEVSFGGDGNDVIFGADHDQVLFGDDGDDVLFAEGGADQVHGDDGDDTLVGGDGSDLIVGGQGADVIFGGAGDDTIHTAHVYPTNNAPNTFDVVAAGDGDDAIYVSQGAALVEMGSGADDILIYSNFGILDNDPVAIVSDFNPAEDQIVLGVHAPDFEFAEGTTTLEISYTAVLIETPDGPATLIVPAVDDQDMLAEFLGASVGHAVLLGITPDQLEQGNIRVIVTGDQSPSSAQDSIQSTFNAQSIGAGI